jgi:hypothetical protein
MRRVQIVEKPTETYSYAALDRQTGEVLLRLSDRHALIALCQRLEWAVEEKSTRETSNEPGSAAAYIEVERGRESAVQPS